jgi:replicative DNA helicase
VSFHAGGDSRRSFVISHFCLPCGNEDFEKEKLYVIGGRPCMGKEEFMLYIIMETKLPVLFFSTNHQKPDYIQKLLAIHCDIPVMNLF